MRWLSVLRLALLLRRGVRRRLAPDEDLAERGAVSLIVALLLGFGVILGCAAMVIDTGSLLWERRQLQNGADAVSLAVAQTCGATGPCVPTVSTGITALADANAVDGAMVVDGICGSAAVLARYPSPSWSQCVPPAGPPGLVDCPAVAPALSGVRYVEVRTSTLTSSGTTILPPALAQTLAGGGYHGETVRSCARAAWGPPKAMRVLPVTMSYCAWQAATGANPPSNPGTLQTPPQGDWPGYGGVARPPWPTSEVEVSTADSNNPPSPCTTWNGHIAPGGFSALDLSGPCEAAAVVDGWVHGNPGNDDPCTPAGMGSYRGKVAFIPVFDCFADAPVTPLTSATSCNSGNGSSTYYHVAGFAAFYVSGWHFSGDSMPSIRDSHTVCPGNGRCLSGWFTRALGPVGDIDTTNTAPDFGASVVKVAG